MAWVSTTYAWRSLGRHRRRTVLSVIGIGVGCALALFMESMNRGRGELFARIYLARTAGQIDATMDVTTTAAIVRTTSITASAG